MSDLTLTDSSENTANVVHDFVARRYAQIYVKHYEKSPADAEAWAKTKIAKQDRKLFQQYVIKEMKKQGFKGIKT